MKTIVQHQLAFKQLREVEENNQYHDIHNISNTVNARNNQFYIDNKTKLLTKSLYLISN